jgi:hypothetical protein
MVLAGAERLAAGEARINALNVFPVPDGDTGTNMSMTMAAGAAELKAKPSDEAGRAAEVLSKGLLMGARGNSGVILSQLFRGFAKAVAGQRELNAELFALALQQGVDTAYKAVAKPVEGTILTVAREAARHGVTAARRTGDLAEWMAEVHAKAEETLARTPEMLAVLKQVGVVDSGGQGLVCLYEGFLAYLRACEGGPVPEVGAFAAAAPAPRAAAVSALKPAATAQSRIATESITYPYDMEFFIQRSEGSAPFPEVSFRRALERDGDSVVLADDGGLVKVHVHSRRPGDVLNLALAYGELTDVRILNMRQQHRELLAGAAPDDTGKPAFAPAAEGSEPLGLETASFFPGQTPLPELAPSPESEMNPDACEMAPFGIVAVCAGDGNADLFRSLGADVILSGGTGMNPSTEDLLQAVRSLSAAHVLILPNHPNVVMAARQAADLADRPATVIDTRSVPQGMAAMLAFREDEPPEANARRMAEAAQRVRTGQVTQAVRSAGMDGLDIREGHYIGILEKAIVVSEPTLEEACRALLGRMLDSDAEMLTILAGEEAEPEATRKLADWVAAEYPDVEAEVHQGGQPLYPYWFAVE